MLFTQINSAICEQPSFSEEEETACFYEVGKKRKKALRKVSSAEARATLLVVRKQNQKRFKLDKEKLVLGRAALAHSH